MQRSHASCGPTLLLVRLGVGAPAVDALGLVVLFCFTGTGVGRLLPGRATKSGLAHVDAHAALDCAL